MFEPNKPRYLTRGVDAEIPLETINEHFNNEFDKMHKNDLAG